MKAIISILMILVLASCHPKSCLLEPNFCELPQPEWVANNPSAFDLLTEEELKEDWAKEMLIGRAFADEMDLYRAITSYKRAAILVPAERLQRRLQIEYDIILCYYLGKKYADVIEIFESSELTRLGSQFPAFRNLLIMLYDSYQKIGNEEKACALLQLIEKFSPETAGDLALSTALTEGNIEEAEEMIDCCKYPEVCGFLDTYHEEAKSVRKAQFLNAVLPGAGYLYVGQKKSALTSFCINALFTAAAYTFFHKGYVAAGVIATSLEVGWYVGGINGAGLEAKAYNERLYEECGRGPIGRSGLFPVLMLETTF